ncbi:MAG: RNA polymerase sigma factor [Turneriella sp.]
MDFAAIIAETKRPVLAAVRRYLDARFAYAIDDVAQEVYLRAYRALTKGRLQDSSKLRSYLYTIARNEALRMNARAEREEKKAEKFLNARREKLSVAADDAIRRTLAGEVAEALAGIPEHYAQVVKLSMLGYSAREIVDELQIRPGTVKSRLSRGLALLREKLT